MHFDAQAAPGVAPRQDSVPAGDGFVLGATIFPPSRPGRGTVIVHGATAVPQTFYRRFAGFLATRGIRVVTYDYRGVGRSRPRRLAGFPATMTDWARRDAAAIHAWVRDHHGDEPLALVGHSFGGQLIGLLDEARDASGALLAATQLPSLGHFPPLHRAVVGAFFKGIIPLAFRMTGYLPGWTGLGVDLPAGVAEEWARWCTEPGGYLVASHPDARARFAAFRRPVLFYSFTDDRLAPVRSVDALLGVLRGADLEHRRVTPDDVGAPIGHFGFFRQRHEGRFWPEAATWLTAVLAGERPPRDIWITAEEIQRDLEYGR